MGILDYDIELAKQAIKRTPGLLNEYIGRLNSTLKDKFAINEMDQKRSMRGLDAMAGGDLKASKQKLDNAIAQKMVNVGLDMNPAAVGQIVWHGSPHKFNKFDMSKIGTGEGAQAYGHGLYFAESPEVGNLYRETLTGGKVEFKYPDSAKKYDKATLDAINKQIPAKSLDEVAALNEQYAKHGISPMADIYSAIKNDDLVPAGATYKVDIPDEAVARFLDWDKPLSQQAPEVQAAIRSQMPDNAWNVMQNRKGQDYVEHYWNGGIGGSGQSYMASQRMSELGIPGIRYLDGGSRGAGQGSSNFVLFDDQMPRILEINGQATGLQPWAKGEWRGLLSE